MNIFRHRCYSTPPFVSQPVTIWKKFGLLVSTIKEEQIICKKNFYSIVCSFRLVLHSVHYTSSPTIQVGLFYLFPYLLCVGQVCFNLILQTHLPYMLGCSTTFNTCSVLDRFVFSYYASSPTRQVWLLYLFQFLLYAGQVCVYLIIQTHLPYKITYCS